MQREGGCVKYVAVVMLSIVLMSLHQGNPGVEMRQRSGRRGKEPMGEEN